MNLEFGIMNYELDNFLLLIKDQLIAHLGEKILGIYVYGSISYGDYEEFRSDIDVMVFLSYRFDEKDFVDLKEVYDLPEIRKNKYLKKLEADHLFIGDLNPVKNRVDTICFRGEKLIRSSTNGLSRDLQNLFDCGVVVYGPKPSLFIPKIEKSLLDEALTNEFVHLKEKVPEWSKLNFWNQMFIIVQLCRVIYSFKNEEYVVSKKKAARWCCKNVPSEFRSIVEKSLKGIDDWEKPLDDEIENKLGGFMKYTEKLLSDFDFEK